MSTLTPEDELAWKDYDKLVDLYKFWLETLVKVNLYFFGIAGGVLSFVLTKETQPATLLILVGLLLPMGLAVVLAAIFHRSAKFFERLNKTALRLRKKVNPRVSPATVPSFSDVGWVATQHMAVAGTSPSLQVDSSLRCTR